MKDIEELKKHKLTKTVITGWYYHDESARRLTVKGDFNTDESVVSDYKHYDLWFSDIQEEISGNIDKNLSGGVLQGIDFFKEGDLYKIHIELSGNNRIVFRCENIWYNLKRYRGISYKNVYETKEFMECFKKAAYVVKEEFLVRQEKYDLPDGYSLEINGYEDVEDNVFKAFLAKCILRCGQEIVYEYESLYNHVRPFMEFIEHSNGHRYYPFHIDLYGISYLEMDTGKVYNYVPQGYDNDWGSFYGESFIITDVHYDANTDLIAYGGCYWAAPSEVMVGDFSDPLNFNPRLFNVHELIDPEYEEIDDVDFVRWEEGELVVKADFKKEYKIGLEKIVF